MLQNLNFQQMLNRVLVQICFPAMAVIIILITLPDWEPRNHWPVLFSFTVLALVCSFAPIRTFSATTLTLNNAIILCGLLLEGTWIGIWAGMIEVVILAFLFKSSINRSLANAGQVLTTIWIVGTLKELLYPSIVPWMFTDLLLIVIYWVVNTSLCAILVSFYANTSWINAFRKMVKSGTSTYLMLMIIGEIGARLVDSYGTLSVIPLGAAFITFSVVFHQYYKGLHNLEQKIEEIKSLNHSFLIAMAASIDAKDHYTSGHSQRVAYWGREIAMAIGLSKENVEEVYFGGILHDIGKIGIEDEILNKDGKLTPEEFDKIKQHTVIGYEIVKQAGVFQELLPAIRSHHERIDGKGYPDGLINDEIPLVARILAISDAFDAMVSDRPYRQGVPVEIALERIEEASGTQFDEKLAKVFIQIIRNMPHDELIAIIHQAKAIKNNHLKGAL